jgi:PAS domain-containing protein
MAADSAPNDELGALRTKVAKLTEINRALMQRVEHGLDLHGNAYHLFHAAILLDRMVRDRTRELEQALEAVATSNRELNGAAVVSMTTQNRLQDAIDSISEGFAIFDPEDRLILFNRRFTDFWPGLGAEMRTGLTLRGLIRIALERGAASRAGRAERRGMDRRPHAARKHRRHGADRWVYAQSSGRWVRSTTATRRSKAAWPRSTPTSPTSRTRSARSASARSPNVRCTCRRRWRACRSASRCSTRTSAW